MSIKLYWSLGSGRDNPSRRNFGDYLSPLIVEAVSGKQVEYAPLSRADLMAIGTILIRERKARFLGFKRKIHVWGSGCGQEDESFSGRHYYHAVRGAETLRRIEGNVGPVTLGDPGLLAPLLLKKAVAKQYKIGFVPHYVDKGLSTVVEFIDKNKEVHFIDVHKPPIQVIEEIAACEFVISSSMHGLIVADAFKVPNVRIRLSARVKSELKYKDYYSAFNISQPKPIDLKDLTGVVKKIDYYCIDYDRPGLDDVLTCLVKSFPHVA
jgi:hypothetical protein